MLPRRSKSDEEDEEPWETSPRTGLLTGEEKKESPWRLRSILSNVRRRLFSPRPRPDPTQPDVYSFESARAGSSSPPSPPVDLGQQTSLSPFFLEPHDSPPYQRMGAETPLRSPPPPSRPESPATPHRPRPKRSTSPTPPIVKQFRKKDSLSPDVEAMSRHFGQLELDPEQMGRELARQSREGMEEVKKGQRAGKSVRMVGVLEGLERQRGFRKVAEPGKQPRWMPPRERRRPPHRSLMPSASRTRSTEDLFDRRFSQPMRTMGSSRPASRILPPGRASLGPIPGSGRQRSYSVADLQDVYKDLGVKGAEDPSQYTKPQMAFIDRLKKLSPEDRKRWSEMRRFSDPREDKLARTRMIKPPTIGHLREMDKQYMSNLMSISSQLAAQPRGKRAEFWKKHSPLPSVLSEEHEYQHMPSVSEEGPYQFKPIANPWTPQVDPEMSVYSSAEASAARYPQFRERTHSAPSTMPTTFQGRSVGNVPLSSRERDVYANVPNQRAMLREAARSAMNPFAGLPPQAFQPPSASSTARQEARLGPSSTVTNPFRQGYQVVGPSPSAYGGQSYGGPSVGFRPTASGSSYGGQAYGGPSQGFRPTGSALSRHIQSSGRGMGSSGGMDPFAGLQPRRGSSQRGGTSSRTSSRSTNPFERMGHMR